MIINFKVSSTKMSNLILKTNEFYRKRVEMVGEFKHQNPV